MNAIEIRDLSKSFRGMYAVDHLALRTKDIPKAKQLLEQKYAKVKMAGDRLRMSGNQLVLRVELRIW